jgi:N-formylglutamate deformylase
MHDAPPSWRSKGEAMQPRIETAAAPSHVVLDSPHSGRSYPPDFEHACPLDRLRQAEDFLVDELFAFAPELGASLISAPFPRSYIDVNRAPEDIDPELLSPDERSGVPPSAKSELGIGLIWRLLEGNERIYARQLTRAEIDERIARCWLPYHAALAQAISAAHERHGHSLHLNCHSMPSCSRLYPSALGHTMPFDFLVGDRDGTTAGAVVTGRVATLLRAQGFLVGVNEIFKGVELVRRHSDPANHRHSIQLEINRKLYMHEDRLEVHAGFSRVQAVLQRLVRELVAWTQH